MDVKLKAVKNVILSLPKTERTISVDAEWDVNKSTRGMSRGPDRIGTVQIGYRQISNGTVHALILQVSPFTVTRADNQRLDSLHDLLVSDGIIITGRAVGGDLKKIANDMLWTPHQKQSLELLSVVDLGTMARQRDVVKSGNVSLQDLVRVTLNEHLDKQLQISSTTSWSAKVLSPAQERYAALDAIKSLEVYFHLQTLKDLTLRLHSNVLGPDFKVDIVPATGCVTVLGSRAAIGTVQSGTTQWSPPPGCHVRGSGCDRTLNIMHTGSDRCLVTVNKVLASNLVVPDVVKNKMKMSLGDFGAVPFDVMLPICMLKEHVDSEKVRPYPCVSGTVSVGMTSPGKQSADSHSAPAQHVTPDNVPVHTEPEHVSDVHHQNQSVDADITTQDHNECPSEEAGMLSEDEELSEQEIMWVRSAADSSQNALPHSYLQNGASLLDPQPDQIHDVFSTVLGDAFHFMDRVRVPMHHELKKAYFYSLSEAFFAWDDTAMRTVKNVLREKLRYDHDCV
jgi:hypothetical protein